MRPIAFSIVSSAFALMILGGFAPPQSSGKSVVVNMLHDARGMRYEPSRITIARGDTVKFVNISGGPHNVEFDRGTVPAEAISALSAAMSTELGDLKGDLISAPNASFTIVFHDVPPGKYRFFCTPHGREGMSGTITVK